MKFRTKAAHLKQFLQLGHNKGRLDVEKLGGVLHLDEEAVPLLGHSLLTLLLMLGQRSKVHADQLQNETF